MKFLRAKSNGTPEGEGVYLTEYPGLGPNTDSMSFYNDFFNNITDN